MRHTHDLESQGPDRIRQELRRAVDALYRRIGRQQDVLDEMQQVRDLLDSVPLPSGEYCTATNRLRNAHRYLVSDERGAARYELQMLANSLRRVEAADVGPRLKRRENVSFR